MPFYNFEQLKKILGRIVPPRRINKIIFSLSRGEKFKMEITSVFGDKYEFENINNLANFIQINDYFYVKNKYGDNPKENLDKIYYVSKNSKKIFFNIE